MSNDPNSTGDGFTNKPYRVTPQGKPQDKVAFYGWTIVDEPGRLRWIPKDELRIDATYQREKVNNDRVLKIAQAWSWMACGVLLAGERSDGTIWVYDGQHRKLAADKRSDIPTLPVLVFPTEGVQGEARGFTQANTVRGPMHTIDKFRGMLASGHVAAQAVNDMVVKSGYQISRTGDRRIGFAGSLIEAWLQDPAVTQDSWALAVDIAAGANVEARLFNALFYVNLFLHKQKLPLLGNQPENREKLISSGLPAVMASMQREVVYHQRGGPRVDGQGIVALINKNRRTHTLPSVIAPPEEEG